MLVASSQDWNKFVGTKIRLRRYEMKLTQSQVGRKLRLSGSAICQVEQGVYDCGVTIARVSKRLKLSLPVLIAEFSNELQLSNLKVQAEAYATLLKLQKSN